MPKLLKRLVNQSEEAVDAELQSLANEYGYRVHIKIRVADVLRVEGSGIYDDLFSFALKAHFDFVISDANSDPLFAVEFDGPSHRLENQQERDAQKDELCERFELPILRINTNHLVKKYNKASLLRWIISAWELQKSFLQGQKTGQIPFDEDFDPIMLWHHPGKTIEEMHPHWIALKPRLHIERLHKQGKLPVGGTCGLIFRTDKSHYRGIEWIDLNDGSVVMAESGMREQRFPLYLGSLFDELMTIQLYDELIRHLSSGTSGRKPDDVAAHVRRLQEHHQLASCHTGPTRVKVSIDFGPGWAPIRTNDGASRI